jgi:hypothetical protein
MGAVLRLNLADLLGNLSQCIVCGWQELRLREHNAWSNDSRDRQDSGRCLQRPT